MSVCFPRLKRFQLLCSLLPSLSLFSFWDPFNVNVSMLDVVLEVS